MIKNFFIKSNLMIRVKEITNGEQINQETNE